MAFPAAAVAAKPRNGVAVAPGRDGPCASVQREVLEDVDGSPPRSAAGIDDPTWLDRSEPREDALVRQLVVAVGRVSHDPVDGQRDDRVARDPANLAEGGRLAIAEVLEDL